MPSIIKRDAAELEKGKKGGKDEKKRGEKLRGRIVNA